MEETAIKVSHLSKRYAIRNTQAENRLLKNLLQYLYTWKNKKQDESFYALKDISFEIKKGETVGIIGSNGAGKSTLLKILSEVTEMTEGKVEIDGKIASVLEIGMGIHPELSGRENIYLSGAMLGLSKYYIDTKFDDIVEFSGIRKFIDTPVKHYSTGMYMRLAFSVVVNVDADILLFDEVLNVGDVVFKAKCEKKILELIEQKKTILIVSHNVSDIYKLCEKVIYLENGELKNFGYKSTINEYLNKVYKLKNAINYLEENNKINLLEKDITENELLLLKLLSYMISSKGEIYDGVNTYKENIKLKIILESYTTKKLNFGFALKLYETYIAETDTIYSENIFDFSAYQNRRLTVSLDLPKEILLASGTYILTFYILNSDNTLLYSNDFLFYSKAEIETDQDIRNDTILCPLKFKNKITVQIDSEL